MHFGSLSVREFYWRVHEVVSKFKGKPSEIPTNLHGQLLFRDMYFAAQASLGHAFSQTINNSHCRFIPWHLPSTHSPTTGRPTGSYTIDSPTAETHFRRWKVGQTGFPFIDALMRQLAREGWIHHLGRHAVACFLTRGGCYVHWERGAEVFEEYLIDHETACNAGNWQWLACVAFFAQFYRCYSPVAFGKKWDPEGDFVRRYVPELERFSKKYIYEPWKAPIADQKAWGCVVRGDGSVREEGEYKVYPKPMLDFSERREMCIQGMKAAYAVGLYGDDEKVKNGSWRKLFDDHGEGPTEGNDGPEMGMVEGEEGHVDMDWDGMVHENDGEVNAVKDGGTKKGIKSPQSTKHQREKSQGTLDGHIKRQKK